ncbi:MAG TPA: VanZ family protein [Longimicrobiales bacterium]|nr:VanZ family protein [Longimicrobiales bacterium]
MGAYAPAALWAGVLLFVGGRSDVPSIDTTLPIDKLAHLLMYGFLGILTTLGWLHTRRPSSVLIPLVFAVLVGAVDELHQRSVPLRSSDYKDWIADVAGIGAASYLLIRYRKTNVV